MTPWEGPQYKTDARRSGGTGDWATYQLRKASETTDGVAHAKAKAKPGYRFLLAQPTLSAEDRFLALPARSYGRSGRRAKGPIWHVRRAGGEWSVFAHSGRPGWRLRTAKPPYRRRSRPECSDSNSGPPGGSRRRSGAQDPMVCLSQSTPLVRLDQSQHWLLSRQPICRQKTAPALAIGSGGGSGGSIIYHHSICVFIDKQS
jgi:hypothetical protein